MEIENVKLFSGSYKRVKSDGTEEDVTMESKTYSGKQTINFCGEDGTEWAKDLKVDFEGIPESNTETYKIEGSSTDKYSKFYSCDTKNYVQTKINQTKSFNLKILKYIFLKQI